MERWALTPGLDETSRWAFIVGAPRCGTTALSEYLRTHPEICFSTPKEPHFFLRYDLRNEGTEELRQTVLDRYLELYFPERHASSLFAEGSVSYFYAPEQLEPILRLWPRAKFIICLRNPLQMVPSLHQRLFYNGDETERQFDRAWSLVPERRNGRYIPRSCIEPRFLDYWEAGQLGKHLDRFLSVVGPERCHISIFDDFKKNPGAEYRRVLEFLELPDDERTDFDRHAESKDCRIAWVHRLMKRPPKAAMWLFDREDLQVMVEGVGKPSPLLDKIMEIRGKIIDWNKVPATEPQIGTRVLGEMRDMFQKDVALLSDLLDRDLRHWLEAA
ncbi:MAG TPA: sulfotransferase [Sphingomicrobium sp.]|nr:sulfotransferase [Sphingomicrobium sp.]